MLTVRYRLAVSDGIKALENDCALEGDLVWSIMISKVFARLDYMATAREDIELERLRHQVELIRQQIDESVARTAKVTKETKWYEYIVMSGSIAGLLAVGKFFL